MNWIDIVILVIVCCSAFRGFITGLIKSITGLLGVVVGILAAYKYHQALTDYFIAGWQLDKKIMPLYKHILGFILPSDAYNITLITIQQAENYSQLLSPLVLKIVQQNSINNSGTIGDMLSLGLAQGTLNIISFVLLLIAVDLAIKFLGNILHGIVDWGIFAPFNRVGGALFGVVRGVLLVFIIMAVLMPLQLPFALVGGETSITQAVENSKLGSYFWKMLAKLDWSPAGNWLKPMILEKYMNSV